MRQDASVRSGGGLLDPEPPCSTDFPRSSVKEIGLRLSENRATHRKIGLADSSLIAHALSNNSCPHQLVQLVQLVHRPPLSWNEPNRSARSVRATARQSPTLGPMPRHRPRHPQQHKGLTQRMKTRARKPSKAPQRMRTGRTQRRPL